MGSRQPNRRAANTRQSSDCPDTPKQQTKKKGSERRAARGTPWIIAWSILLVVCLTAGAATKASYTDFTTDKEALMNLRYSYVPYLAEEVEHLIETPGSGYIADDELFDSAELVVEGEFTGERAYQYLAFLSQVQVTRVLKGDATLEGTILAVYEPIAIQPRDSSIFPPEEWDSLSNHFGYTENENFYQLEAQDAYYFGGTMMVEEGHYVLFLQKRVYSEAEERAGKQTEYVLCKSPFAKLRVDSNLSAENYSLSVRYLTLAETAPYDVLATDEASAEEYFETRDKLLRQLEEQP